MLPAIIFRRLRDRVDRRRGVFRVLDLFLVHLAAQRPPHVRGFRRLSSRRETDFPRAVGARFLGRVSTGISSTFGLALVVRLTAAIVGTSPHPSPWDLGLGDRPSLSPCLSLSVSGGRDFRSDLVVGRDILHSLTTVTDSFISIFIHVQIADGPVTV